ncbi:hypothetical protein JTB14_037531 [Gonioctena quinquepunctata]|nr:hypothetical protein JTB14_037531 [Gonioctena quinquepunctata]
MLLRASSFPAPFQYQQILGLIKAMSLGDECPVRKFLLVQYFQKALPDVSMILNKVVSTFPDPERPENLKNDVQSYRAGKKKRKRENSNFRIESKFRVCDFTGHS